MFGGVVRHANLKLAGGICFDNLTLHSGDIFPTKARDVNGAITCKSVISQCSTSYFSTTFCRTLSEKSPLSLWNCVKLYVLQASNIADIPGD